MKAEYQMTMYFSWKLTPSFLSPKKWNNKGEMDISKMTIEWDPQQYFSQDDRIAYLDVMPCDLVQI